ncbi:MAG: hypothetical protein WCA85_35380 [Paraburkholderia sp.]|uniref:hypothetical protein n=1 Tax=Paraburkholderia sp. TaxID=1926495 RepID=UPI003C43A887
MLSQAVVNSLPLDAARTPAVTLPQTPQADAGNSGLAQFAERMQGSLESMTVPLGVLFDPSRRRGLSTAELLWLQAAAGEYSASLLTLSHIAQSVGSTIQSLTQRT